MATSQNGYPANDINLTSVRTIPGTQRKIRLRNGPAGDLLLWVLSQFDRLVEDIDGGELDDWGYAERLIRGSTTELSNHASGTAADANATRHPLGTEPGATFNAAQIATIRSIVARTEGCVRWGGDYTGRKDPMHFEINAGEARCAAVLAKLTSSNKPDPTMEEIMTMALPQPLPRATEWQQLTFPVEVGALKDGGNSSVVAAMWLTLVSAWDGAGTTEYHVWISNDRGDRVEATPGSHSVNGVIKNNGFALIGLPKGARVVTLEYRNTGKAQAGYAFPQVSQ